MDSERKTCNSKHVKKGFITFIDHPLKLILVMTQQVS